jgi:hypothetical protein
VTVTVLAAVHEELGATFRSVEGTRVVDHYGTATRAHLAVRNGVGLAELPRAVCRLSERRREALAAVFEGALPAVDGEATYAVSWTTRCAARRRARCRGRPVVSRLAWSGRVAV